jgi:hypothetical protein
MEIRYVRKVVVIFHGDIQHSISHSKQGKKYSTIQNKPPKAGYTMKTKSSRSEPH